MAWYDVPGVTKPLPWSDIGSGLKSFFNPEAGKFDVLDMGTLGLSEVGQRIASGVKQGQRDEQRAIENASRSQSEAMDKATDLQREMYQQNRTDLMPWMDSSKKYLGRMGEMYDQGAFTMPNEDLEGPAFNFDMQMDPGYKFRMGQAQEALGKMASARGNRLSGGSMADLMDRAQGVASDEYSNAYNRAYGRYGDEYNRRGNAYNRRASNMANQFNMLSGMGGMGASQSMVGMGQNYGNTMGNLFMQQGQNQANTIMAQQQARQNNPWAPQNWFTPQTLLQGAGMLIK